MTEMDDICTTQDVAEMLHCSTHQVSSFRRYGLIKGTRFGKNWLYDKKGILEFISLCKGKDFFNFKEMTPEAARKKYLES